jgi:hypothetical protein
MMFKKITLLMAVGLAISSFTYFGKNSDFPNKPIEKVIRFNADAGYSSGNESRTHNPGFVNIPMKFEGAKTVGDAEIGPEIPITGLTGFYDYQFNGNQDHYIYRFSSTIMHAVYMLSEDSSNYNDTRRVKYAFSSDDGDTWTDLGEVPSNFRAGFPTSNAKVTGEASISSHYLDNAGNLQSWINYDIAPGIGVFTAVQAPEAFAWPIQARVTNGNMLALGTTWRGAAATDTTTLAVFNNTTNTFGPRHDFFHSGNSNNNSSLAIASGPNGKAMVVVNAYRETGGNLGFSRIFASTTADNGNTWNTPFVLYDTQIINGDTAAPYVNGATDVIYDNAGNTYLAFNTMGAAGFYSTSLARLYVQKNNETPTLVAGGSTSPVYPISGSMVGTAHQQAFIGALDHPCLSISSDQQYIFVSYGVLFEDDTLNGFNKSHVFYSWAPLSTLQWQPPVEVTDSGPNSFDERYCSISTVALLEGGYYTIYMTYQKDTQPGSYAYNDNAPESRTWLVFRKITDATLIGVNNNQQIVKQYRLFQNYPNPFNPSTRIDYNLTRSSFVVLKVYDILGKEVKTLINGTESPGAHNVHLNASELPSGVYFYTIKATDQSSGNTFTDTKKMVLVK